MDWNPLIDVGKVVKVVGGVLVAVTTLWKVLPKFWAKITGWMMHEIQSQIADMSKDITFIASELKTNGGRSLRDSVIRNEKTLGRIEAMTQNNIEIQRARMDNDDQMIFLADEKGNCTWVNRSYSRHTGRTIEEIKGSGWVNVIHPASREETVETWYESVKHNREFEMVVSFLDTAGVAFKADIRSYKMTSADGKTTGFMSIGEVISAA